MAKPEGYATLGPFMVLQVIKNELQEICAKESDESTSKKKTLETKVTELIVEGIRKYKPAFEIPDSNGDKT